VAFFFRTHARHRHGPGGKPTDIGEYRIGARNRYDLGRAMSQRREGGRGTEKEVDRSAVRAIERAEQVKLEIRDRLDRPPVFIHAAGGETTQSSSRAPLAERVKRGDHDAAKPVRHSRAQHERADAWVDAVAVQHLPESPPAIGGKAGEENVDG